MEGAIPSLISDGLLGVICLILAIRQGRGRELLQTQVTPKKDPDGPQPLLHYDEPADEAAQWHAAEEAGEAAVVDAAVEDAAVEDAAIGAAPAGAATPAVSADGDAAVGAARVSESARDAAVARLRR